MGRYDESEKEVQASEYRNVILLFFINTTTQTIKINIT